MRLHRYIAKAFTLVETTLAVGVVGFGLLAIFGLLPVALVSSRTATGQTAANGVASAVIADLRATHDAQDESGLYKIRIPSNPQTASDDQVLYFDDDGIFSTSLEATSRFRVTIGFVAGSHERSATRAKLQVSWPAAAPIGRETGSVEAFVAMDRN